jgi:hypothetical protein
MTGHTSFGFERSMFVRERPLLVCVALNAPGVCSGCQSGLLQLKATVWIMAIAAFDHSFQDFVMEWLIEVGLDFVMTADAKLRLTNLQ